MRLGTRLSICSPARAAALKDKRPLGGLADEICLKSKRGQCCLETQVIIWVLGEYGELAPGGVSAVVDRLCYLADAASLSVPVRAYLITALAKLCSQASKRPSTACVQDSVPGSESPEGRRPLEAH